MKILGIHDGHTATACLLDNGEITSMASEERFTNIKNKGGFPKNAVNWILKYNHLDAKDIDHVVMPGLIEPIVDISAYLTGRHKTFTNALRILPSSILSSPLIRDTYLNQKKKNREKLEKYKSIFNEMELKRNEVNFIEHHKCHAATAYYLNWNFSPEKKVLIFTLDGSGDGVSATVHIGHNHEMETLKTISSYNSLGMLYSRMTQFLGMKPLEHEYKLMGMAPYAPDFLVKKSYDVLKNYIQLDQSGLSFINTSGTWGNETIKRFQKDFVKHRFDGICGALQLLTEELALSWIKNWVEETGINDIVVAGGVFMNVKLNMLINEDPAINSAFFMPSCGDESIALGASLYHYVKECKNNKLPMDIHPLNSLYLGPEYTNDEILEELNNTDGLNYKYHEDINSKVVELLLDRKNVARFNGRMEFGARSLGNRSILARPDDWECVRKINKAIKMRDFWMPFAPSILDTSVNKYLITNGSVKAPYMILGYNTTMDAQDEIIAGLHQSDQTCRPQIIEKDWNPSYYDLLKQFEAESGLSGLLNTSFNIHGYPIANSPKDAIWTLINSELDALQMGSYLVTRK